MLGEWVKSNIQNLATRSTLGIKYNEFSLEHFKESDMSEISTCSFGKKETVESTCLDCGSELHIECRGREITKGGLEE